jgi:nucleotide-binding universal stress UspA family protein
MTEVGLAPLPAVVILLAANGYLLSSTAERVAHGSHCPVIFVR